MLDWIESSACWLPTFILLALTFFLVSHYVKVTTLPPGPFPLPIVGNILAFKTSKKPELVVESWRRIYGDIFTIWLGSVPYVVVCSWELIREALVTRKSDFSGRLGRTSEEKSKEGSEGILQCDFGSTWKALRKLTQSAIRKFAASERLARTVCDVTDDVVELMASKKKSFEPDELLELAVVNILASSVFGKRYKMDDKEFQELQRLFQIITSEFGTGGNIGDFFPILKMFYRKREKRILEIASAIHVFVDKKLNEHLTTFQSGDIRDLTDALLAGREEMLHETKQEMKELKNDNIKMAICDIFLAGIQTTYEVLRWTVLLISNHPEIQEKMKNEITDVIGDRMPVQEDRTKCPFIMAVIMEAMRFRPPLSFGITHKSIRDSQIGSCKIPKDTGVAFLFENTNRDVRLWSDDHQVFRPERFLEKEDSIQGFFPFGEGQRKCVGKKLALEEIFLIICRLYQKLTFHLEGGAGSADLKPKNFVNLNICKPYKVVVTPNLY